MRIRESSADLIIAASNFVLGEFRMDSQVTWFGRNLHTLKRDRRLSHEGEESVLLNNDSPMGNLQFLI